MVTGAGFPVDINRQAGNKNHAPGGVPGRDSGVAGGDIVMFIYLATVTRLGVHALAVYCSEVQPGPRYVDTRQKWPVRQLLRRRRQICAGSGRRCHCDQRQFAGTKRGGIVLLAQTQPSAPATTVTGLRVTVSPLSTLPGATCLYSTVIIPVRAAAVTLDT